MLVTKIHIKIDITIFFQNRIEIDRIFKKQNCDDTNNSSSDWFTLQAPINDDKATSLLIGLSLESKKEHIVRAVLESLAFRFALLYETVLKETRTRLSSDIRFISFHTPGDHSPNFVKFPDD